MRNLTRLGDMIILAVVGALIGCTIISFIGIMIALAMGPENFMISGTTLINSVLGAIIVGFGFALPSVIYENENISLPYQILFQMGIGFIVLLIVGVIVGWIPVNQGILPVVIWIAIAVVFAAVVWILFYLYERFEAQKINKKLDDIKKL